MKKMLALALAGLIALALIKALASRQQDHDVWAEFADEI